MNKKSRNRLCLRRGNAMVEFAFASLVLVPLFFGAFQFGYTFYVYNLLCTQIRAGARYASIAQCPGSNSGIANFKTAVKNVVLYGNATPSNTDSVIEPGLTAAMIDVQINGANGAPASATNKPATVTVTTATGGNAYTVNAVITTFTFSGKPYLQIPYTGQWAPAL